MSKPAMSLELKVHATENLRSTQRLISELVVDSELDTLDDTFEASPQQSIVS